MNDVDLQGVKNEASPPGKENKHFHIAPLDPVLKDGGSALRQHFVRGERPGQKRAPGFSTYTPESEVPGISC
jgi:hypothetical protein